MKKLMKGNEAIAEAAVRGGCRFFAGYPITPQNEIPEYLSWRLFEVGGQFVQSESEVAAINMVYGAAAAGTRAMTSSSSPGISLKQEGISYIAGAELPCVIINMVRGGPGLGGIQPAQSDYFQATKGGGHGDYHMLVYGPNSVQECVDILYNAFDKADEYRIPVMILGDGMLGQMMEPVTFKVGEIQHHDASEKPWATNGHGNKRKHNIVNSLYLQAEELERLNIERFERYETVKKELHEAEHADIVVAAYGSVARLAKAAVDRAREAGIKAGLVRPVTLWPFPVQEVREACRNAKRVLCVEMSMGQMIDDVKLALDCRIPVEFYGRTCGVVPKTTAIFEQIKLLSEKEAE